MLSIQQPNATALPVIDGFEAFGVKTTLETMQRPRQQTKIRGEKCKCRVSSDEGILARARLQTASVLTEFDENPDL